MNVASLRTATCDVILASDSVTARFGLSHLGPSHLGSPIPWVLLAYVEFLINLSVTEFDNEVEQDVLEEIDPDMVSYTFSTRGGDQLIYLNKVYQIKKNLPTAAGPF